MGREMLEINSVRESDQNRPAKKPKDEISEKELSNKMEVEREAWIMNIAKYCQMSMDSKNGRKRSYNAILI